MKKIVLSAPLLIIIAACLWGIDGVIRRSLFSLPPITIVFYEHLIGALLLLPFVVKQLLKERVSNRDFQLLGLVSLLSGLLGTLWFTTALLKTNFIAFSVVFLLQQLEPVFTIASARLLLKEKITKNYIGWAIVAIVAAYFVTFRNGIVDFSTGAGTIIAALYALGAAAAWGTSTTFSKMILQKNSYVLVTGLRFLFTTIMAFVAVLIMGQVNSFTQPDSSQMLRFLIIALSTGMFAMVLYYKGLQQVQAKYSTLLELVFPLTAVAIDVLVYKSFLAPTQYLAAAILLGAIYKISRIARQEKTSFKVE